MPTPPPPLTPPPASSWSRVRGTPAGGGEGSSERWGELRSPHLSRSLLPSAEIKKCFGWTSGNRGMVRRERGKHSFPHLSRSLRSLGESQLRFGWTLWEGGNGSGRVGRRSCPTLSKKSSPSFVGVDRRLDVPCAARDEAYSEKWTERTSPQLTRFIRLLIRSSLGGLKFEGWGEPCSPHPSKDSSPPPASPLSRRTFPNAGGGVRGGGPRAPAPTAES